MDNLIRSKFLVNIKSLTCESKFIRKEEKKHKEDWKRDSLRNHRVISVRQESRITNLAYAFALGKTYKQVESKVNNPLTSEAAHRIFLKLKRKGLTVDKEDVKIWLQGV